MKIVQNALFRSCAARFGQIAFWSVNVLKIVTRAWNSLQNEKTVRFSWKLYKTLVSGHAEHVLAKSHFEASNFQNRHTGLKFSTKLENRALSMKIVQNALFRSCAARFGQIAFLRVKVFKIVKLAWNSLQNRKTVRFQENCTKPAFQVMRSTFWPNLIFERQSSQSRETGLKFSSKRKNSALFMKIVQNALFRSCAVGFGQIAFWSVKVFKIVKLASNSVQSGKRVRFSGHVHFFKTKKQCAFLSVKVLKIVTLAWNSLQIGKTVRFSWKLYNTLFSGHAQQVLAKSHFGASKFSKSSRGPEILSKTRKQCAFHENCTTRSFQVMRISSKQKNSALSKNFFTKPAFQVMRSTSWPNLIF